MKKIISIILVLVMAFSLCATAAFADNAKSGIQMNPSKDINKDNKIIYTALGASESNGYGLPEYNIVNGKADNRIYKYAHVVDEAYPAIFSRAINATVFNQDCLAGMRSEDLLYLIDPSYNGDEYTHGMAFGNYVMVENGIIKDGINSVSQLRSLYQKHVKEADVITVSIGMNNFAQYIRKQLERSANGNAPYDMPLSEDAENMLNSPMFKEMRTMLYAAATAAKLPVGYVEVVMKALAYTYTDNLKSFDRIIDRIYEVNPNAEVYVLGLYNALPQLYLINNMFDIGQYNAKLMSSVNDHYMSTVSKKAQAGKHITYVDIWNTETWGVPNNLLGTDFYNKLMAENSKNAHPDYNGHEYVYEQLAAKAKANGWTLCDPFENIQKPDGSKLPFVDVKSNDWFYDGVAYCYEKGYMQGTSATTFEPQKIINRAQLITTIYRMAGSPSVFGMTEPFSDVSESHWAYKAIVWGYNKGIIRGTSATTFEPGSPVTRGQAVTMLCRYEGPVINSNSYTQFKDASSIPGDFRSAVSWAVDNGIIQGYEDGCFHSNYALSRAQMAVIISRFDK